ncbi:ITBP1 protein, partial [Circaetus pectoralis]|nr:ITBP1 protein [Circaetus pectoralis]
MFRKGKKRHSSSSSQSSEISTKSKNSITVLEFFRIALFYFVAGQSNSNSDTCAEFRVKYVGAIEKLNYNESKSLEGPLDLINYIDVAQQDGKLPFVPGEEEFIMGVSKYGIKVSTSDQYDVLHRHALYLIVRMVCYDDGLGAGKSLLALKTTDAASEECSLWVYQCNSLEQAQAICKVLSTAFDSVLMSEKS